MSDNAASNDLREEEVHGASTGQADPPPGESTQTQASNDDNAEGTDIEGDLNLEAALSALPTGEEDLDAPEIDPDTLANLAALSRITQEDEEGGDGQDDSDDLGIHGVHDFANLMGQGALTGEQVQQIVDSLGDVQPQSDDHEDQSPPPETATHTDDESEREGTHDDGSRRGDEDYRGSKQYYEDRKQKRRRNRTVL